jgi:sirohydrochlorin ferrochelatase
VVTGFYQDTPGFTAALDRTTAGRVLVVPLFTGYGHHADEMLPVALRVSYRFLATELRQAAPIGCHPSLPGLIGRRVERIVVSTGLRRQETTVLLVGHGAKEDPRSRTAAESVAAALHRTGVTGAVATAFLDEEPSVAAAVAAAGPSVVVVPFLIGGGARAVRDLPAQLGLAPSAGPESAAAGMVGGRRILLDLPVGAYPELADLVAELARAEMPAPAFTKGSLAVP